MAAPVAVTNRLRARYVALVLVLAGMVLSACTEQQIEIIDRINETRTEHDLPELLPHPAAMAKAQAWAETMAADLDLRHSTLSDGMTGEWLVIGENVGYSGDIATVHQAFLDSPGHRANILDARFNWVGAGYAESDDGRIWVAQVFAQY